MFIDYKYMMYAGTILGDRDAVNKTDRNVTPHVAYTLERVSQNLNILYTRT